MMDKARTSLPDCGEGKNAPEAAPPARTLIVGCNGRMGKMLSLRAAAAGLETTGMDVPFEEKEIRNICSDLSMLLLCVPAKHLEKTLQIFTPHLGRETIVADITSVKEMPMRQMEKAWQGPVVGTHPLFGPKAQPGDDLPVVLVRGNKATDLHMSSVRSFYESMGCRVFNASASQHDKAMSRIQNLNFITNAAYFAALADQDELLPFLTPSFTRRKQAAAKMLTEDGDMFCGLFEANPYSQEAARQFRRMLDLAASGDVQLLCKRAQWWFNDKPA